MSTPLQPQQIRNLGVHGVMRQVSVDDNLIPEGAAIDAKNVHFDRAGAVTVRPGMATLGATIALGYPIWGLHNIQNGTMMAVISQGGSARIYTFNGGASWTSNLTTGTANVKVRFVNFARRVTALNWGVATTEYSTMRMWTGDANVASWTTTGNPINPQQIASNTIFPTLGEVYKSKMYLAGDRTNPDRLYFSSVIDTNGNITWNPANDFVDINPNDGENITALKRYSLQLLIFKPNYTYQFRTTGLDPDPLITVGTRSQESVIEGKRGIYFHHDTGFYRYTGGYPTEISRPIADFVDAVTYANYDDVVAWKDSDHIYWYVGNVTIAETTGSETWLNVVVRYTESSEIWTIYSYPNSIKFASTYNSGAALSRVAGLDNGVVATINSGTTDLGEPIRFRVRTPWKEWEGVYAQKVIEKLLAICEKAGGSNLRYQVEDDTAWRDLGQLRKYKTIFKDLHRFHRIRFQWDGSSRDEAPIFRGVEVVSGQNQGLVENE